MTYKRRKTRPVYVGSVKIGGNAPISVQSMTLTDTRDVKATVGQIERLTDAGCEIVRVAVPDHEAAEAIKSIKKQITIPLIADIHFDYRLAVESIENGVDCVRVNPGNMKRDHIATVVEVAREHDISLRVGVNAGSMEKDILERYGGPTASALVESALRHITFMEDLNFDAIKLSLKSSDVSTMIEAYREISKKTDYPLHLGVTEAGSLVGSAIKSSIGLGMLLYEGIGDTLRVSITGDPVQEINVAYGILRALGIRKVGPEIISCPTCGRCEIDLLKLAEEVEQRLAGMKQYFKIALMGCIVNGPGEAAEADIGLAGGKKKGVIFKKGKIARTVREEGFVDALIEEIHAMEQQLSSGETEDQENNRTVTEE